MRIDLFRKLDQLAPAYLLRRRTGDLVSMATQDVETVEYFFAHTIANAFVSLVVPGAALVTLFVVDWRLGLGLAPLLVVAGLSPLFTRSIVDRLGSRSRDHLGALNAHMVDTLQGLREVTAFQREPERKAEFEGLMRDYRPVRAGFNRQISTQRTLLEGLTGFGGLAVLTIGGALAVRGEVDSSLAPMLTLLAMGAFMPVAELAQVGRRLGDTLRRDATPDRGTQRARGRPRTGPGQRCAAMVLPAAGSRKARLLASASPTRTRRGRRSMPSRSTCGRGGTVALVGPSGARQDDGCASHAALLGPAGRLDHARERGPAQLPARRAARPGGAGRAGHLPVQRLDPRQPPRRPGPTRARTSSCSRSSAPASPTSSSRCRTGSTRRWASVGRSSPAGSDSGSPSVARC